MRYRLFLVPLLLLVCHFADAAQPAAAAEQPQQQAATSRKPYRQISGIYPHLAYWNTHGECGTGAVVPWAGKLRVITYAPHQPNGSTDQLYSINEDLDVEAFAGSVGGTPANRMIHQESNQLLIGPYVIDQAGEIRVISPAKMPGRLTGNARHLSDPANKAYYATMEEGFYEVDVHTLEVTELYADSQSQNAKSEQRVAGLPGYHGKGLYSGQGRLIYANNGETSAEAKKRPDVPSGCLAEWDGQTWNVIRRNQFTDVRGPGDLTGNADPANDPIWAIGWDHRSLMLMLLDQGEWSTYRLPKASHCYDGAHGWNTEWPRIHDIGEEDFVMTMHGMFWRFPKTFTRENSAGIKPRSSYLKVIGDYCRWKDQLVFGCDDTAQKEFLNTRRAKGKIAGPGQSHSNLWFASPEILDQLGAPLGRGAIWTKDAVKAGAPSDPYLFSGFERRTVCLTHDGKTPVRFRFEVDQQGNDQWSELAEVVVPPGESVWHTFSASDPGVWIRIAADQDCQQASAQFHYANQDRRDANAASIFAGLRTAASSDYSQGLVRVRGDKLQTLAFAATQVVDGKPVHTGFYELDEELNLTDSHDPTAFEWMEANVAIPQDAIAVDQASVLYVDDEGKRWRLPKHPAAQVRDQDLGPVRVAREVATERDLFNCGGTFYELPARNAGGIAKVRPICTHDYAVHDFCSYRGLMIFSGVEATAEPGEHLLVSEDGKVALWAGAIDDLWKLGKPAGVGGPWKQSQVKANVPSDPYLMTGYDQKRLTLASDADTTITIEVDVTGTGDWRQYKAIEAKGDETVSFDFPAEFQAYWVRLASSEDAQVTGQFVYQ
ncbi:hypothetical protein [Blastopirellula retiformator]|uniref:Uncharacterized protein n=1 Tax=Blastopirellula retiformator TaxID=2527970 RepID=A0A5C5V6J5_9BACT|nr:hypothetical protein [Blastopirellula retiformator]TWT34136.1 hypothetical protein Enr8_15290 [Blastopirellula retiformator]